MHVLNTSVCKSSLPSSIIYYIYIYINIIIYILSWAWLIEVLPYLYNFFGAMKYSRSNDKKNKKEEDNFISTIFGGTLIVVIVRACSCVHMYMSMYVVSNLLSWWYRSYSINYQDYHSGMKKIEWCFLELMYCSLILWELIYSGWISWAWRSMLNAK